MIPRSLLPVALLAVSTACAHAQGINLAWNNCISQTDAAVNKNYACDGSHTGDPIKLVASFKPYSNLDHFVGIQMVIDVKMPAWPGFGDTLPDWWRLGVGECRENAITFPASMAGIGTSAPMCFSPWTGANTGGGFQYTSFHGGNPGWGRLLTAFARDSETTLAAGQHYLSGVVTLDLGGDLPDPDFPNQCLGCCSPLTITLNQIELYQTAGQIPPQQDIYILNVADVRQYVTWQASGTCQQTASRRTTWGSIKATYR